MYYNNPMAVSSGQYIHEEPAYGPSPSVIAHRGASGLAPENTLAAFKLAILLGSDGVELDVQLTGDGYPVVLHDRRVNRTTNGRGAVHKLTANEISELDAGTWFDRRLRFRPRIRAMVENANGGLGFAAERVPHLQSALLMLREFEVRHCFIELKTYPPQRDALVEAVVRLALDLRMERTITLLSFDHDSIRRVKTLAPVIRTVATFPISGRGPVSARRIIRSLQQAGADGAALHVGLVTRRTVEILHNAGFLVSAWTANSAMVMRRLILCGVDSIITNFPDRLIGVRDSEFRGRVWRPDRKVLR